MVYHYLPVEQVYYGTKVVSNHLLDIFKRNNVNRVLIVTTSSFTKTKAYKDLIELMNSINELKSFIILSRQHVPSDVLMDQMSAVREFCPDLILSCGGGSCIDAAKIISLILSENIENEEELIEYSVNVGAKQAQMSQKLRHITIPTTLSAAEFTSIAGVTYKINKMKYIFSHLNLTPNVVFLDPEFTLETPQWLWLSTGIRAVDHAVETLYSPVLNPINESLALQALKNLYTFLPKSKENENNLEYRLNCQLGAWMSLFSNVNIKLGLSHCIGHQLGSHYNIPHGMTSAIMLPHVMEFLLPRTYKQQAKITHVLDEKNDEINEERKAEKAPEFIRNLIKRLDIPHQLSHFNVAKDSIPGVVDDILKDLHGEENDFVLQTDRLHEELMDLLEKAW